MKTERDLKSPDSVLKRLSNKRVDGQSVQNAQVFFVLERFLARVSQSHYRDQLVLKGGILLYLLTQRWNRPTEDLDLLALRIPGESMESVLTEILGIDLGDRLEFQPHSMTWEEIREDTGYPCRRFTIPFRFGPRHSSSIKLDLSFGDPVTPGPKLIEISPMLSLEGFQGGLVMGYPVETFLAEKVETLLVRGMATTRAKDLFDLWVVSRTGLQLQLKAISEALRVTADYRAAQVGRSGTVLRQDASALQPGYGTDATLKRVWASYVGPRHLVTPTHEEVVAEVQAFIRPMIHQSLEPGPDASWDPIQRCWQST
jgi:hypothetical protein